MENEIRDSVICCINRIMKLAMDNHEKKQVWVEYSAHVNELRISFYPDMPVWDSSKVDDIPCVKIEFYLDDLQGNIKKASELCLKLLGAEMKIKRFIS